MPKLSYPTRGISGTCPEGETILSALQALGYTVDHACGGNARCGTCCVRVVQGERSLSPVGPEEAAMLQELGLGAPHRLSCQARIHGDVVVLPGW